MPSYHYRCEGECSYVKVFQLLSDEPLSSCVQCNQPTRRAIIPEGMARVDTYVPSLDREYFTQLARYPGDPQAHVSGPDSLRRLKEARKEMGWTIHEKNQPDVIDTVQARRKEVHKDVREKFHESMGL